MCRPDTGFLRALVKHKGIPGLCQDGVKSGRLGMVLTNMFVSLSRGVLFADTPAEWTSGCIFRLKAVEGAGQEEIPNSVQAV